MTLFLWRICLLRTVVFLLLSVSLGADHAQAAGSSMFESVTPLASLSSHSSNIAGVKRTRFVRIAPSVSGARIDPHRIDNRLTLNLFHDREFELAVEDQRATDSNGITFRGRIEDHPDNVAQFVYQNGVMAGVVNVPGEGVFRIQYVGEGVHEIVELNPLEMGRCGVGLRLDENGVASFGDDDPPAESTDLSGKVGSPFVPRPEGQPTVQNDDPVIVDIMIAYTELAMEGAGGKDGIETLAQLAVEESNFCFANSGINMELNLVNIRQVDYAETGDIHLDLDNLSDGNIPGLNGLRQNDYKADLVSLITERETSGTIAGVAWILSDFDIARNRDETAFSVVRRAYAVGNYTFPHEIGHNFGCAHDVANADTVERAFSYSHGERFVAQGITYATVMSYPPGVRIPYFSNPNVSYNGVPTGSLTATDNAATINFTAPNVVSKYLNASRRFSFGDTQFIGNESGEAVRVTVKRLESAASNGGVSSINYVTVDGSAKSGADYMAASGTLIFLPPDTEKEFFVNLIDDSSSELPESFSVQLLNPLPSGDSALGAPDSALILVEDDESSFFLQVESVSVVENVGLASVLVERGGQRDTLATVDYSLINVSAVAGEDFVADSGQIIFLPGDKSKQVDVVIVDDFVAEADETFRLQFSNPSTGMVLIELDNVAIRVLDDDRPGGLVPYADTSSGFNDVVYSVKSRPNGELLVGGKFSQVHGVPQAGIAQLNPDGTLDSSFDPGTGIAGLVLAIELLPDGRVVAVGGFGAVNGVPRVNVALFHEDGSLDESFDPGTGANNWIRDVAIDREGRIVVGGFFTSFQGIPRNFVARLNSDGSLDESFNPGTGPNNAVHAIAVDADGKIVIGGDFTQFNGQSRGYFGRLLADGSWDASFASGSGASSSVRALTVLSDGNILLGGRFTSVNGHPARYIGRLLSNGSVDTSFGTGGGPDDFVYAVAGNPVDNSVVISGNFTAVDSFARSRIAKLSSTGSVDTEFDPGSGANALVWSIDLDASGRVHLGGEFTQVNGLPRSRVATLRMTANQGVFEPVLSPFAQSNFVGGEVRLEFSVRPGKTYALEYAHDLGGAWTPIVTNTASSETMELSDASPASDRRYYRVRQVN